MILVLVPKSPKRRSDTAAPPPPPPRSCPVIAFSLGSPLAEGGSCSHGKNDMDAGTPNFVQDSATVSPSPVGMWRFMWYFCRCVYLELVEQEGHLIRLTLRDRQYRAFLAEDASEGGCREPCPGGLPISHRGLWYCQHTHGHKLFAPLWVSAPFLQFLTLNPLLILAGIWGSH